MSHLQPKGSRRSRRTLRRLRRRSGGFILPVMLVASFVVALGTSTLTSRALGIRLGGGLQDQAREARDAADSGFEAVVAELNKDENRMLAASNVPVQSWDSTNEKLRNPCLEASVPPTSEAINLSDGFWRDVPGNANMRYRIRSVEVKNALRSERIKSDLFPAAGAPANVSRGSYDPGKFELETDPNNQLSRIEITIEGQSLRNGKTVATSMVTSELGVVPKCCGVSIGDADAKPGNFCESRFPRLLIGLNGGGIMQAGTRSELRQQAAGSTSTSTSKPASVLCVNSSGSCGGNVKTSVDGVPIKTIKLTPPALPAYPANDNRTGAASGSNGYTIVSTSSADSAAAVASTATQSQNYQDYLRVNSAGVVQLCNVTNNNFTQAGTTNAGAEPAMPASFVTNSCDSRINSYCSRTGDSADTYAYHCRIARLFVTDNAVNCTTAATATSDVCEQRRIQNNTFFIDSSRARIFLHFNSPWVTSATCGWLPSGSTAPANASICTYGFETSTSYIQGYDDGQIQHLYCPTAPADGTPCNQRATPDFTPRATLYSNTNIAMRIGEDGYVRDLFTYMPQGTVILQEDGNSVDNAYGVPNYRGPMWINNLWMGLRSLNYQTRISVPPFSSTFTGLGKASLDNPFRLMPYYEWIVRGSSVRSVYGS